MQGRCPHGGTAGAIVLPSAIDFSLLSPCLAERVWGNQSQTTVTVNFWSGSVELGDGLLIYSALHTWSSKPILGNDSPILAQERPRRTLLEQ